jgi:hypothetical protein
MSSMDSEAFWELIEVGKNDVDELQQRLEDLPEEELVDFYWRLEERAADLQGERFQEHMDEGLSEDSIDDLTAWVVRQGEDFFEDVNADPSEMPSELPKGGGKESYTGRVAKLYRKRYGKGVRMREDPPPDE